MCLFSLFFFFFFFNDTATTEIYTLSLHDALPIYACRRSYRCSFRSLELGEAPPHEIDPDRKSTRLNSSHTVISYAVFCLKKKKKKDKFKQQIMNSNSRRLGYNVSFEYIVSDRYNI